MFTLIGIGILLRLYYYIINPSIYCDEAWSILDIVYRSFKEILFAEKLNHHTPIGLSLAIKSVVSVFGQSDHTWRFFSFVCSITGIFLFNSLLRKITHPKAAPFALALFVFSQRLIFYSVDAKQYTCDVLFSLVLLLIAHNLASGRFNTREITLAGITGSLALWFSYPSAFTLAGTGLPLLFFSFLKKDLKKTGILLSIFFFWSCSFALLYFVSLRELTSSASLLNPWNRYFCRQPLSFQGLHCLWNQILHFFRNPSGLFPPILGFFVFITGCVQIFQKNKESFLILICPLFLVFTASVMNKYPFFERLLLFMLPSTFIFLSEGILFFFRLFKNKTTAFSFGLAVSVIILAPPIISSGKYIWQPDLKGDIRPIVQYLQKNYQQGDLIYLNNSAQYGLWYYLFSNTTEAKSLNLNLFSDHTRMKDGKPHTKMLTMRWDIDGQKQFLHTIYPNTSSTLYLDSQNLLPKKERNWVIFSHLYPGEDKFMLEYLDSIGSRKDELKSEGSAIYLYDLTDSP